MTDTSTSNAAQATPPKWWVNSMTIWGVILTATTTVLPVLAPIVGLKGITPDTVQQVGDGLTQLVQAMGGLIGTGLAIYGRVRATGPLQLIP